MSIKDTERLAEADIEPLLGQRRRQRRPCLGGDNGLYKAEVIHRRRAWRSFETVEYVTLEWVDRIKHRRLLEPIGNIPPAQAQEQDHAAADYIDMAA